VRPCRDLAVYRFRVLRTPRGANDAARIPVLLERTRNSNFIA
jgi:hypothetical protein